MLWLTLDQMDQEQKLEHEGPCRYDENACESTCVCKNCIENLRSKGVPEHTLKWLQLDKMSRIETVMF